ncbi:hypothetical protein [Sporomusa sp.]|uniref:hypothetical protein n=1 Tax=Sporomusa sp. TaxID=2078658 RepID=UPI002C656B7D|nr:hypothetical protein [Sporomusa sp.]HWR43403.1 hypothetical protein [Sporomusa sp.]
MICQNCKTEIPANEESKYRGQILCEDCYIEMLEPPRSCDVAAVYSAKSARKAAGQEGTDGLTDLQKNIYDYVKKQGPVTHDQVMQHLSLSRLQLDKNFAILRHCELLRAFRENDQVFVTVWTEGGPGELKINDR